MPSDAISSEDAQVRERYLSEALTLEYLSVVFGVASAVWSVTAGLLAGSLGIVGLGLNMLADVAGSATLVWRFRVEQRDPGRADRAEAVAALVVAGGLIIVAVFLGTEAIRALAAGSAAGRSVSALMSAGAAAVMLTPLGLAKYRIGGALHSRALKGDGTLSGIGAGLGVVALLGLVAEQFFGWWWADRVAALLAASVAGAEVVRVLRQRYRPSPTD